MPALAVILALVFAGLLGADAPKLVIVQPALHDYEDSPPISGSHRFYPGDRVFLSFRIGGFQTTQGEERSLKLTYRVQPEDDRGIPLEPPFDNKVDTTVSAQDKDWMPRVRHAFSVPPLAGAGTYRVRISVTDELAKAETRTELAFRVAGRQVEPSETLVIRNFRFLRTEEDAPRGLEPPAYRPGDPVFARFEITGYKLVEKNRFSVEYGLEVLKPDGERIFAEPNAASEQQESFYPKQYVEGGLQVGFKPPLAPGVYTVVVTVRDRIGDQSFEDRFSFQVE